MKMMKRNWLLSLGIGGLLCAALVSGCARKQEQPAALAEAEYASQVITDLAGRSVTLAAPVQRVIAIAGPSYEKTFMLGQAGRLVGAHWVMVERPWVVATNPRIGSVQPIQNPAEPNVEALLSLETDCVFFASSETVKDLPAIGKYCFIS
jgi:ABC-type Fe3+-hydroxamate transport system substrate-binding protein